MSRDAGFFAEVRGEGVYGEGGGGDEAVACGLVAVCGAEAGTEVAVEEVGVAEGVFMGDGGGGEGEVAGGVVIEEEGGGEVEGPIGCEEMGGEACGGAGGGAKRVGHTSHWEGRGACLD